MSTPSPTLAAPTWQSVARLVIGLTLVVVLVGWGLPWAANTTWEAIFGVLREVSGGALVLMLALSLTALSSYALALAASLPGLRWAQALLINVCGSSVSKLLPGGGALGLAATFTIARSWGFTLPAISTSAVVTLVWNTLGRIVLPVIALGLITLASLGQPDGAGAAAGASAVVGLLIIAVFVAAIASERVARTVGEAMNRTVGAPIRRRKPRLDVTAGVLGVRERIIDIVSRRWYVLTAGMAGFFALQFALFLLCLAVTGAALPFVAAFGAFALGRLLSGVGVTPGGLGFAETGTAAALVYWGAPTAEAGAAVVLFSLFTNVIEIPYGAVGWTVWLARRRPAGE